MRQTLQFEKPITYETLEEHLNSAVKELGWKLYVTDEQKWVHQLPEGRNFQVYDYTTLTLCAKPWRRMWCTTDKYRSQIGSVSFYSYPILSAKGGDFQILFKTITKIKPQQMYAGSGYHILS